MSEIKEGYVVICGDGRSGTYLGDYGSQACVLINDGLIWYGNYNTLREPQDQADLDAATNLTIDRFVGR